MPAFQNKEAPLFLCEGRAENWGKQKSISPLVALPGAGFPGTWGKAFTLGKVPYKH